VNHIEELDGAMVRFSIVLHRNKRDERVTVEAPIVRRSRVRSSSGRSQERIIVSTEVVLGGVRKTIEVSLASRHRMIFRMLLGRNAVAGDFLIDPSRRYVCSKPARKTKKRGVRTKKLEAGPRGPSKAAKIAKVKKKKRRRNR